MKKICLGEIQTISTLTTTLEILLEQQHALSPRVSIVMGRDLILRLAIFWGYFASRLYGFLHHPVSRSLHWQPILLESCSKWALRSAAPEESKSTEESNISANSIYFDISITDIEIGRLVFHLENPSPLPRHTNNLIELCKGSRRGIDPKAHYVGCEFDFSPATIEDGMGRYRWGHPLKGRGRNAIGRADEA